MRDFFRFGSRRNQDTGSADLDRRRALQVLAGAGVAAGASVSGMKEVVAQVLGTSEQIALAGSVNAADHIAQEASTPAGRLSLFKQILGDLAAAAPFGDKSATHGRSLVFIKDTGRGAIAVDGKLTSLDDGTPSLRDVSAYIQLGERTLAEMRTFDFEPERSFVVFRIAVLGNNVRVPQNIIDIGQREDAAAIFGRLHVLFSGQAATAISVSMDKKTGTIDTCGVTIPITNLDPEIEKLSARNTSPAPLTEIVLANDSPHSQYRTTPETQAYAAQLWHGIAKYFTAGT